MGGTPKSPDPRATAAADAEAGQYAAGQNFWNQNLASEKNPYGEKTNYQTGTTKVYDPFKGTYYDQPTYGSNVQLSPDEQAILGTNTQMRKNLGDLGVSQSARMKDLLKSSIDISGAQDWTAAQAPDAVRRDEGATDRSAIEAAMMQRYTEQANPRNEQQRVAASLRGLDPGSQGFGSMAKMQGDEFAGATRDAYLASGDESRRAQDAYNAATQQKYTMGADYATQLNQLRQGQVSEDFALRNQDYNEMAALAGLSQVNNPTFNQFQGSSVQAAPIGQYIYDDYNNRSQQASNKMSGITGVASAVAGALPWASWLSDRRAKTDITPIGSHLAGAPLYTFRYWNNPTRWHVGVMADEVKAIHPDAVRMNGNGYDYVDYGILRRRHAIG